jgi:hypothetical protein
MVIAVDYAVRGIAAYDCAAEYVRGSRYIRHCLEQHALGNTAGLTCDPFRCSIAGIHVGRVWLVHVLLGAEPHSIAEPAFLRPK